MRTLAIARRIIWQLLRDKRTLAMILVAPLMVLGLLSVIFNSDAYRPKIAAPGAPAPVLAKLAEAARVTTPTPEVAAAQLRAGTIDAIVAFDGGRPRVQVEGSDPSVTRAVMLALSRVAAQQMPELAYLHGSAEMSAFDNFGPVLLGFLIFFFTFMVSGISFIRERTSGTLERMLATPVRRWEIVLGYLLGFAGIVAAQATLIAAFAVHVLGMMLVGSFVWLLVTVLLIAASALTLGMLLSAAARSEFQIVQFIPLVVVPQVFFSGLFPMETMHPALQALGKVLPLTYAADALRAVMIRGAGVADIAVDLAVLAGCSLAFLLANIVALKRLRRL